MSNGKNSEGKTLWDEANNCQTTLQKANQKMMKKQRKALWNTANTYKQHVIAPLLACPAAKSQLLMGNSMVKSVYIHIYIYI